VKKTSIRKDIFLFLKNPDFNPYPNLSIKDKIVILLKILILTYFALFITNILTNILKDLNIISDVSSKILKITNHQNVRNSNYRIYFIFFIIFSTPLFEEFTFRLFLKKFKLKYFIFSISLLLGLYISSFFERYFWTPKSFFPLLLIGKFYIIIISAIIGLGLYTLRDKIVKLEKFWNNNSRLIFYIVAILFSIIHITSIQFDNSDWIYMPIILLPYFIYGISFGYIRIKLGLIYSITLHFLILCIHFGLPILITALKANNG